MSSSQEVIKFSIRVNPNLPELDLRALMERFRPNKMELSYKPNWYVILIQNGSIENWIHFKLGSDVKLIKILNRTILDLAYLAPSGFGKLQSYVRRPGGFIRHPETLKKLLRCPSAHRIRRILSCSHFPYLAPRAFTLGAITLQWLLSDFVKLQENYKIPSSHGYIKLISRYKALSKFPSLTKHSSPQLLEYQGHISLIICFLV